MTKNKTRSVRVNKIHLERALVAREKKETWSCLSQCILAQALHIKDRHDFVEYETVEIGGVRYELAQPIGRELQKAFIWDVEKCRSMLPVSIQMTPQR